MPPGFGDVLLGRVIDESATVEVEHAPGSFEACPTVGR
jgi:hypothetical protein